MSVGSLLYQFRTKYQHGLKAAYYRDHFRQRILDTAPIVGTDSSLAEIHVLTSAQDWLNLVWTLKTFYYYSQRKYGLCIHDDGSLTVDHQNELLKHFPNAQIIQRKEADIRMMELLKGYPRCLALRETNQLSLKVFDFLAYLTADRLILLDSDVLFFRAPEELLQRIEDPQYLRNTVNADTASAYTVDVEAARREYAVELIECFNSGLGLIHKASLRLDWIEEFLSYPPIFGHFWRIEQTLFALLSSRFGVELLPGTYRVNLAKGLSGLPCRHYVGAIRHLMYAEGLRDLRRQDFFKALEAA